MHTECDDLSTNLMLMKSELLALSDSDAQLIEALINGPHCIIHAYCGKIADSHYM